MVYRRAVVQERRGRDDARRRAGEGVREVVADDLEVDRGLEDDLDGEALEVLGLDLEGVDCDFEDLDGEVWDCEDLEAGAVWSRMA